MRSFHLKGLLKKLLQIEDTPERTALAFSIGIFLGFSPFLGFHTLGGLAIAFLFKLNRIAVLVGVWSNTPWWIVPYYTVATWVGTGLVGYRVDWSLLERLFQSGKEKGFLTPEFWMLLASQRELLGAFLTGSLMLALFLGLLAYPLSLKWIRYYRSQKPSFTP